MFFPLWPNLPDCRASAGVEGVGFAPSPANADRPWEAVFSQYLRKVEGLGMVMGRTVRTERYRYTERTSTDDQIIARELYDHASDPGENDNIADSPADTQAIREMVAVLHGPKNKLLAAVAR